MSSDTSDVRGKFIVHYLEMSSDTSDAFQHARIGDVDYFQSVELDVLKNSRFGSRDTLLSTAALYGQLSCCQVIYRRCPQLLYERTNYGSSPLHEAACNGHTEVIKFLLTARATLEQEAKGIEIEGGGVETVDEELLMMVTNDSGETALHFALAHGRFQSAKLLIEVDRNKKLLRMVNTNYKQTALHYAVKFHYLEIVELLVEADPDFEYSADIDGKTTLFMAWEQALSGNQKRVKIRNFLIQRQSSQCAVRTGPNGWTILHHASCKGDLAAIEEIIRSNSSCSELVGNEGENFLHLATKFQHENVVKYVLGLENISDNVLNGQDMNGDTPLHIATTKKSTIIALSLLSDHRVKNFIKNKQGNNAFAAVSNVVLEKLIEDKIPIKCAMKGDLEFFRAIQEDVLRKCTDEYGESVLSTAVKEGHLNCCEVIFERCPELLFKTNKKGFSTLHTAVSNGQNDIVKFLLRARGKVVDYELLILASDNQCTALHFAAEGGHFQSAKLLIEADPSNKLLVMKNLYQETALHMAVKEHHLEIVQLLVDAHPHFEYSNNNVGYTPLLTALQEASSGDQRTVEIRKLLIEKQSTQPIGSNKWTLLHHATHIGDLNAIKEIMHFAPDCCDLLDKEGQNFLHIAAKFNQVNVVKYVLELTTLGEHVLNEKDIYGNTPLHVAISCGNQGISSHLLDDPRVNKMIENLEGKKALDMGPSVPFHCAIKGDEDFFLSIQVDVLRKSTDEYGNSLLFAAASKGHLNCCELISKKCPELLYKTNKIGVGTLHTAASNGNAEIVKCLLSARGKAEQEGVHNFGSGVGEGKIDTELLMMVSNNQRTALHYSVDNGHLMLAKLLIEADPTYKLLRMIDNHKETALHYAVKNHHLEIVKLLVEADSNFEYSANDSGETPLSMALKEATSHDPITVDIRGFLIQKQTSQCKIHTGRNGWTLLQNAASKADLSAIEEIIQFCPDSLALVDKEGQNFLHIAVSSKHEHVVNYILGLPDISDSVLNGKDKHGETPLHIATKMGSVCIALSLLYDHRVRKMIPNKNGKNALDAIRFDYNKRRAGVLGLVGEGDEKELKDQSDFDLLVGALISTVSFTAGITVPGGFNSDGQNKGMAILYKKETFVLFVAFNTIALVLSLFAVFTHFCMKRLVDEKEISLQRKVATVCSIGAIFAMVVAFIMGSIAVLSTSLLLVLIVCGICSIFFVCAFYSLWRMRRQQRRRRAIVQ